MSLISVTSNKSYDRSMACCKMLAQASEGCSYSVRRLPARLWPARGDLLHLCVAHDANICHSAHC